MDIEQLRHTWQHASFKAADLDSDNRRIAGRLAAGRAQSAVVKLFRYYRRASIQALALPVLSPVLYFEIDLPLWIAAIYAFFGIVMAALLSTFARSISTVDLTSIPTVKAMQLSLDIKRRQRLLRCFSISTGVFIIISIFFAIIDTDETSVLWGFFIGLIIGGILGIKRYLDANRLIREMQQELSSIE